MNVLILGCGRVGARVATVLSKAHRVTVIDWRQSAFDRLGPDFAGDTIVGNGIDIDVLRDAGIEEADLFLAVTDGDNRNLMAGQIARYVKVPRVLVRVYDPVRAEIFARTGLETIDPTTASAQRLFAMVVGEGGGS